MKKLILNICLLATLSISVQAQNGLQSPDDFLGYELGTRFTPHHKVVAYYEHVAGAMSNVTSQRYGLTNELRPLMVNMISSQENMNKLEQIRTDNLKRTGMMEGTPSGDNTGIVWLSYNVHGNEANSTETAMKTLYELANPNHTASKDWLKNTLVILDPCINPDGRDRYSNWINQVAGTTANPSRDAQEHREPWPGGRANHYLFDLNRDWAWQKQVESQQRMKLYNQWFPQIHVDFHEQGSNSPYYFAPAAEPVHEQVTGWQREFQTMIGKNHAKYFDQNGWLFFTKESFDILYPSYGDSYPMYNGAIGMTYEQGSSDLAIETDEGDTLKLADAIAHHYTTGMSTIEVASVNNARMLSEFTKYFNDAMTNPKSKYKSYVFSGNNHPDKMKKLQEMLDRHSIKYGTSSTKKPIAGFNYQNNTTEDFSINASDIVISTFQPKAVLLQALFEPNTYASTNQTYDITAWSVPYMLDLEAYASEVKLGVQETTFAAHQRNVIVVGKPAAYLAKWESLEDAKFLAAILKSGIKLRYATVEFTVNGNTFAPGSLIITRKGNMHMRAKFDEIVQDAAESFNRDLYSTPTTFVDSGKDFGSNNVPFLEAPKVLALRGNGVRSLAFGEFWYFMEQELNYPITMVDTDDFGRIDLDNYNTIVMPSGSYGRMLGKDKMEELKSWVRSGGRVIALEGALNTFADKEGFSLKRYADDKEKEAAGEKTDEEKEAAALTPYNERQKKFDAVRIPGAIFKLKVDNSHPMGFGYPNHYFTIKNNTSRYAYLPNGWNVGIIEGTDAHISGVAGEKAKESLSKTLVFGVENYGGGAMIYMADNPLFRAFWENGKMFVANALFMVGQ